MSPQVYRAIALLFLNKIISERPKARKSDLHESFSRVSSPNPPNTDSRILRCQLLLTHSPKNRLVNLFLSCPKTPFVTVLSQSQTCDERGKETGPEVISKVFQCKLQSQQNDEWNTRTRLEKRGGDGNDEQGLTQLVREDGARFDFLSRIISNISIR